MPSTVACANIHKSKPGLLSALLSMTLIIVAEGTPTILGSVHGYVPKPVLLVMSVRGLDEQACTSASHQDVHASRLLIYGRKAGATTDLQKCAGTNNKFVTMACGNGQAAMSKACFLFKLWVPATVAEAKDAVGKSIGTPSA